MHNVHQQTVKKSLKNFMVDFPISSPQSNQHPIQFGMSKTPIKHIHKNISLLKKNEISQPKNQPINTSPLLEASNHRKKKIQSQRSNYNLEIAQNDQQHLNNQNNRINQRKQIQRCLTLQDYNFKRKKQYARQQKQGFVAKSYKKSSRKIYNHSEIRKYQDNKYKTIEYLNQTIENQQDKFSKAINKVNKKCNQKIQTQTMTKKLMIPKQISPKFNTLDSSNSKNKQTQKQSERKNNYKEKSDGKNFKADQFYIKLKLKKTMQRSAFGIYQNINSQHRSKKYPKTPQLIIDHHQIQLKDRKHDRKTARQNDRNGKKFEDSVWKSGRSYYDNANLDYFIEVYKQQKKIKTQQDITCRNQKEYLIEKYECESKLLQIDSLNSQKMMLQKKKKQGKNGNKVALPYILQNYKTSYNINSEIKNDKQIFKEENYRPWSPHPEDDLQ